MRDNTRLKLMLWFTIIYMIFFTFIALLNGNHEFLYYTIVMSIILIILIIYREKILLSEGIALGLTIVAALHIFGGNVHIAETRLYDIWLLPFLKFDNFVHLVGSFVAGMLAYTFIFQHLNERAKNSKVLLAIIIIFTASGIGALNEVMELGAVAFFDASAQVGDYMNNAFDLLYNLIGAILACVYLLYVQKEQV
ncbi:MAG: DUF2238 domain-containing protein [Candidatus Woesearchaeota archaeon]